MDTELAFNSFQHKLTETYVPITTVSIPSRKTGHAL